MRALLSLILVVVCNAIPAPTSAKTAPYSPTEIATAKAHFLSNFLSSGAVVAAPSANNPDYYYHWVRDAAISMKSFYDHVCDSTAACDSRMKLYMQWVANAQQKSDPNGIDILGEPKYYTSGEVYDKPWGRPQTDSPALRAITMIAWANNLIKANGTSFVLQNLWVADTSKHSVIKWDLEFISHHWQEETFDLWEETKGSHFFTRMVQRRALLDGAALGRLLNDQGASAFYEQQAKALETKIEEHWDGSVIRATMPGSVGPPKYRSLDSAVILGSLYGSTPDGFYGPTSDKVVRTAKALEASMRGVYSVNTADDAAKVPGFLVGRYPNDTYTGYAQGGRGNPWILCTHAMAELYYRFGSADGCFDGDDRMARVHHHVQVDGMHLGEQINRDNGKQQGAPDLTWSYGTLFNAMAARSKNVNCISH